MQTPAEVFARWFGNRRSRCLNCNASLAVPMPRKDRFCSDACAVDYKSMTDAEWQASGL